ncbi:MAG: peroxiredoxin [Planctomycetes bacterium]|nr:peroxiredoxin [Planctomycetota bacterium]
MVWIPGFGRYKAQPGNRVGDHAPDFTLKDDGGHDVTLSHEVGERPVVLVFYPRAGSPICTRQMCSLRDGWGELTARARVFGISYDDVDAIRRFKHDEKLPFVLLSDSDKSVARKYGVHGTFAPARVTFVIDSSGKIESVIEHIKAGDHAAQILASLPRDAGA